MDNNKKRADLGNEGSSRSLLRMGVVFLAVVSFFTTANGMNQYIFIDNKVVAYAASAAIQGILLALSMNLPGFLRGIWARQGKEPEKDAGKGPEIDAGEAPWKIGEKVGKAARKIGSFFIKLLLCAFTAFLTLVTIFCSSWFSYVYIADTIHKGSWGTDSELLVQQTYRTELYNARDYAYTYRIYLEESLGERILLLEEQVRRLDGASANFMIDWDDERTNYVSDLGTTAGVYMAVVIDAMQKALDTDKSEENRDLAATALADAKRNIADRMEGIRRNQEELDRDIERYNNQISSLTNRINRATEGTDTTALTDAINQYTQLIITATDRQADLQAEYMQLDIASQRLTYYESQLGLSSSTSSISIRRNLMQLQSEMFHQEPDEKKMLDIAEEIFKSLRDASSTISAGETEESFSYTDMLLQMNRLIRSLMDYSEIKEIELNLEGFIADLRRVEGMPTKPAESGESGEPGEQGEPGEPGESGGQGEPGEPGGSEGQGEPGASGEPGGQGEADASGEPGGQGEAGASGEPGEQGEPGEPGGSEGQGESGALGGSEGQGEPGATGESGNPDESDRSAVSDSEQNKESSGPDDVETEQWKKEWNTKLTELRAQISAMPVYSGSEDIGDKTVSILSESQADILRSYDRNGSSRELDDIIRRYLSSHNAVYQGIIYLQSPYRSLAIFALVLAFSFDLSGFIFGLVAQGDSEDDKGEADKNDKDDKDTSDEGESGRTASDAQAKWNILKTMKPYIVLTGDYESRDGVYYYKTFKDGLLYIWAVKDPVPYGQGIYAQEETKDEGLRGVQQNPEDDQELLFANQGKAPQDGIYKDCGLFFDEGSLMLKRNDQNRNDQNIFLACIEEYVPVHSYNPTQGQNRTLPAKQLVAKKGKARIAVVALNARGTRIAAIYMIEDE